MSRLLGWWVQDEPKWPRRCSARARSKSGAISIDGDTIPRRGPRQSIGRGVGFLTEDRKDKGLFLGLSVASNIVAPALDEITRKGLLDRSKESDIARRQIGGFSIAAPSPDTRWARSQAAISRRCSSAAGRE